MPPVLVSYADLAHAPGASARRLAAIADAAHAAGWQVLRPGGDDTDAWAAWMPAGAPVVFSGFVPAPGQYERLHDQVAAHGGQPVNSPAASEQVTDFAGWYPRLVDLTPASMVLTCDADCDLVADELGFPVFVKGAVKSTKEAGWQSCLAGDAATLRRRLHDAAGRPVSMRGVVVARQIAPLRRSGRLRHDFPISREYRIYLRAGQVITIAPYWEDPDPFGTLTAAEKGELHALSVQAAGRLDADLVCVDVAQRQDGCWIVVEVGDPQFTTLTNVNPLAYFMLLGDALSPSALASAR